jgi:hypothetical protein
MCAELVTVVTIDIPCFSFERLFEPYLTFADVIVSMNVHGWVIYKHVNDVGTWCISSPLLQMQYIVTLTFFVTVSN